MSKSHTDSLWRDFPKTLSEFEERFATEESCRNYLAQCRWNGHLFCDRCGGDRLWPVHEGMHFECAGCAHQMSLTSGTLFHRTRKPLKLWFRAIWEICVHKHGISAADLQRILGFGSYETAWAWLHKIRRAMVRENRDKLNGCAQTDETFVGGKGASKEIVVIAAEEFGRVRLMHAPGNHTECLEHLASNEIDSETTVKTDGHAGYNEKSLGERDHCAQVQTKAERKKNDHLQLCHWTAANLKRWLLGTHHGAVSAKHLQSYLDEYSFRYNRRKTKGVGRLVARSLENMLTQPPLTMRQLIDDTYECRNFEGVSY